MKVLIIAFSLICSFKSFAQYKLQYNNNPVDDLKMIAKVNLGYVFVAKGDYHKNDITKLQVCLGGYCRFAQGVMFGDNASLIFIHDPGDRFGSAVDASLAKKYLNGAKLIAVNGAQGGLNYPTKGLKKLTAIAWGEVKLGTFVGSTSPLGKSGNDKYKKEVLKSLPLGSLSIAKNSQIIAPISMRALKANSNGMAFYSVDGLGDEVIFTINDNKPENNKGEYYILLRSESLPQPKKKVGKKKKKKKKSKNLFEIKL